MKIERAIQAEATLENVHTFLRPGESLCIYADGTYGVSEAGAEPRTTTQRWVCGEAPGSCTLYSILHKRIDRRIASA